MKGGAETGVEPRRGFVHQEDVRATEERAGHRQALLHAGGVGSVGPVGVVGECGDVEGELNPLAPLVPIEAVEACEELEVLPPGKSLVERAFVSDDESDARAEVRTGEGEELPVETNLASMWEQDASAAAHERGLSGAVGAEEGDDASGGELERDVVQRERWEGSTNDERPDEPAVRRKSNADAAYAEHTLRTFVIGLR